MDGLAITYLVGVGIATFLTVRFPQPLPVPSFVADLLFAINIMVWPLSVLYGLLRLVFAPFPALMFCVIVLGTTWSLI